MIGKLARWVAFPVGAVLVIPYAVVGRPLIWVGLVGTVLLLASMPMTWIDEDRRHRRG